MRKLRLYRHRIHMAWLVLRGKVVVHDPRVTSFTTTSGTGTRVTTMQGGWR
jgi:hypothetical protein